MAWEPMKGLWQQTTSPGPSTEEQALDLAWDSGGPLAEGQELDSAGPPTEDQTLDLT